ncbi:MAG: hypothetical protein R3Y24_04225 [Eubacteriales bacterium]
MKQCSIKKYLEAHPEIDEYMVIDDDRYLVCHIGCRQVLTKNLISNEAGDLPIICKWIELEKLDEKYSDIFRYHMTKYNPKKTDCWFDFDLNDDVSFTIPGKGCFKDIGFESVDLSKEATQMLVNYINSNHLGESSLQ